MKAAMTNYSSTSPKITVNHSGKASTRPVLGNSQVLGEQFQDASGTWRKLEPAHIKELAARGITLETAIEAGLYTETSHEAVHRLLNSKALRARNMPCLVIPFSAEFSRVRPDNPRTSQDKVVKYESPRDRGQRVYVPLDVAKYAQDADQELIITEGEFKALAATQEGFPTIGLVGVLGWKESRREELLGELLHIKWQGRRVYLAFDSDIDRKQHVRDGLARLAKLLTNAGAIVAMLNIPDGPPDADGNATKQGLDDFLVANWGEHKRLLRKLIDEATEPIPIDGGTAKQSAKALDPCDEVAAILRADEQDGVPTVRYWREDYWRWTQGRYETVPAHDVRGSVVRTLNPNYHHLTTSITNNVMDQLRSQSQLPAKVEPPCWLPRRDDKWQPPSDWKATDILPFPNGLLHLPSGEFLARPTPRLFTPIALDFNYETTPSPPSRWLSFLGQCWPDDPTSIELLQEWAGYILTPDTSLQKMLLLIGPKRSGKGTIARVFAGIIGRDNVAAPTLAGLATNFGLQSLIGKTLAIIGDARLSGRTDQAIITERLLSITGEDAITIDRKNQSAVTMRLLARMMILTNELPRLSDSSGALASRFLILQLTKSHYGEEDHGLTDDLLGERVGILNWAIDGWRRLQQRGRFVQSESGEELREQLDDLSSPVGAFVRECCDVAAGNAIQISHLFNGWKAWCITKGREQPGNEQTFGRDIRAAVPTIRTRNLRNNGDRSRFYEGISLKEPFHSAAVNNDSSEF